MKAWVKGGRWRNSRTINKQQRSNLERDSKYVNKTKECEKRNRKRAWSDVKNVKGDVEGKEGVSEVHPARKVDLKRSQKELGQPRNFSQVGLHLFSLKNTVTSSSSVPACTHVAAFLVVQPC